MLDAIHRAGFTGKLVDIPNDSDQANKVVIDVEQLPNPIRETFRRAAKEKRLVLIDLHGPR